MNTFSKSRTRNRESGFTLIELMIAIAIVGILASIAVPAFSNYLGRARISEAINYAEGCKTGFLEYYSTNGTLPDDNVKANCPTIQTDNVQRVVISNYGIQIQMATGAGRTAIPTDMRGRYVYLQPLKADGTLASAGNPIVSWKCSVSTNANGGVANSKAKDLVPAICRNDPVKP